MISQDPYTMRFHPLMKQTIWGGEKLSTLLGKPASGHGNDAESWEIVDHGEDQSVVDKRRPGGQHTGGFDQPGPKLDPGIVPN